MVKKYIVKIGQMMEIVKSAELMWKPVDAL